MAKERLGKIEKYILIVLSAYKFDRAEESRDYIIDFRWFTKDLAKKFYNCKKSVSNTASAVISRSFNTLSEKEFITIVKSGGGLVSTVKLTSKGYRKGKILLNKYIEINRIESFEELYPANI